MTTPTSIFPVLSRSEFVQQVHGKHDHQLWECQAFDLPKPDNWQQHPFTHQQAKDDSAPAKEDHYMTMYGCNSTKYRTADTVEALTSFFVDLDYYKVPGLKEYEYSAIEVYSLIREREPWLPVPTMLVDSGHGCYLIWTFEVVQGREQIEKWKAVEAALVSGLKEYGGDPAAMLTIQVLRIPGSTHSETEKTVTAYLTGKPINFDSFSEQILLEHADREPEQAVIRSTGECPTSIVPIDYPASKPPRRGTRQRWNRVLNMWNRTLIKRGMLTSGRYNALKLACVAISWIEPDMDKRYQMALGFCLKHFHGDINRFSAYLSRLRNVLFGEIRSKGRFKYSDSKIMADFGISHKEWRDHYNRFENLKPKESRGEIRVRTEKKREQAHQLSVNGLSLAQIATALDVSRAMVQKYLKQYSENLNVSGPVYTVHSMKGANGSLLSSLASPVPLISLPIFLNRPKKPLMPVAEIFGLEPLELFGLQPALSRTG